jgi:hypothetical protein
MPRTIKVGEVRFTTSSSTSLYCFRNYQCFLFEVERFWFLVRWICELVSSSTTTSSLNSSPFLLCLVFERLFVTTSSSCLHLQCFTSYLAPGCNPFRVLNQQTYLINLWLVGMFWFCFWSTFNWVFKSKYMITLRSANICFNFLFS